ncbi:UDP-N-acetylmuramate dehydrogenase [Gryllotalpicola protaetiae]|uniref:UDP-N-acetylenolpyruvoylglucosamine reductase n=1 Tax=Gryllotalpicola protaetiae TaxID=2419771 RepID=A0A387C0C4_9MICO|nr:UDP-N-acetylmuramate dehydrogenase [Gryllotalpicola protaetiae]AYG04001.1 UDP-N-acetylmuramate dehydrogenase [Gryllotalpicola protaetiae]
MTDSIPALSELTTLHVGGVPAAFIAPETEAELVEVARELWSRGEPWLILGGGSNTVAPDDGFEGTVLRVMTRGIERLEAPAGEVRLRVQAGEPWDYLVSVAVDNGWAGIETLSGIPGSTGAVPVQNVGAYGQEAASVLVAVDVLDAESLETRRLEASELALGYRDSIFKHGYEGLITAVELRLTQAGPDASAEGAPIAYSQLAAALGVELGARASLAATRDAVIALRRSKGMVLDPSDPDTFSAGSFFTNPIVPEPFARALPGDGPRWPVADQPTHGPVLVKLSAAWLIEHSGIGRGFALPGSRAAVSSKHTLALTNRGGATAREIVQLATFIQARVSNDFGINLQPEPVIL